jgi:large subunit ribosomal protein L22
MAPRKVRLIASVVRGMAVNEAEARLSIDRHRAAGPLLKLLRSAVNGALKKEMDPEKLFISEIRVDQGSMLKRYMPRAQGRGVMIQKKMSHIILGLGENPSQRPARFTMPVREKKKPADEGGRKKPVKKAQPKDEKPEVKEPKTGFFKRSFGRKSGEA